MINHYADADRPFFISLHFNAPHWPWEGPDDEAEAKRLAGKPGGIFDFDGGSQKTYAAMVTRMDYQIGRVLQALEDRGLADDTIVVFTSDNGGERYADTWPFLGRKTELLEGGLRIPAIIRWPGHAPAGASSEQVMISMDWMPTLLADRRDQAGPGLSHGRDEPDGADLRSRRTGEPRPVLALS